MLKHDPGSRMLYLRRRRSRLPWIYLVYHPTLPDAGTPVRRTPRALRDRCRQNPVAIAQPPSSRPVQLPLLPGDTDLPGDGALDGCFEGGVCFVY